MRRGPPAAEIGERMRNPESTSEHLTSPHWRTVETPQQVSNFEGLSWLYYATKGAKGRELKKEGPEQCERFKWMSQLEQEVERTEETLELLLRNKGEEKEARRPVRSLIKPRDVRVLNLSDLQGIEAEGRLKVFLSQIESCSEDVEERKRILMTRVDPQLALYVQNALSMYKFRSWDTLTYWLCEELTDNNVDRILNSISEVKYDCMEDPQDIANKLKCKYAILEAKSK
ncbi:hypothetical protein GWK47_010273 [Chionoecetes opilio]|uniref:Uncharacterized protein n=1 Tax=Chionoecetes opilio TaxID=41210 RepID=A0A8J4XWF1_CHIOP|nr:hypothetical protein GWK47_010273 [Chionoecetes opilio]